MLVSITHQEVMGHILGPLGATEMEFCTNKIIRLYKSPLI